MGSNMQTKLETVSRKLKYKELIEKGSKVGETLENEDVLISFQNILDIVNTCENLSANFVKDGKIENASDYLMDAQILKMSHDLMGSTAEKMGNSDFSEDEYIAALINLSTADTGEHSYDRLGEMAIKCCKTSQFCVPLLGTFEFDAAPRPEKIRKERQTRKTQLGEAKAPENITQLTKGEKGAEKINIVRAEIQRICRQRNTDCLPYYELICHPQSFMKTVDVAFQISFLVRDGFLGLKKIHDEPYVYLYDPDPMTQQSQRGNANETVQCVMTLDTTLWKAKVSKFELRLPLLKLENKDTGIDDEMETDSD